MLVRRAHGARAVVIGFDAVGALAAEAVGVLGLQDGHTMGWWTGQEATGSLRR
jgi:hypothetical protein